MALTIISKSDQEAFTLGLSPKPQMAAAHMVGLLATLESSSIPDKEREAFDDYPTPMSWAVPCVRAVKDLIGYKPRHIIEPSAGEGTFIAACKQNVFDGVVYHANELQDKYLPKLQLIADYAEIGDAKKFLEGQAEIRGPVDCFGEADEQLTAMKDEAALVLGNPPYKLAEEHVRAGLLPLWEGEFVAYLLRVNFLEGKKRAVDFYPEVGLRYVVPFDGRPKFRPNKHGKMGTDATAYAMFLFQKGYKGFAQIPDWRITEDPAFKAKAA